MGAGLKAGADAGVGSTTDGDIDADVDVILRAYVCIELIVNPSIFPHSQLVFVLFFQVLSGSFRL